MMNVDFFRTWDIFSITHLYQKSPGSCLRSPSRTEEPHLRVRLCDKNRPPPLYIDNIVQVEVGTVCDWASPENLWGHLCSACFSKFREERKVRLSSDADHIVPSGKVLCRIKALSPHLLAFSLLCILMSWNGVYTPLLTSHHGFSSSYMLSYLQSECLSLNDHGLLKFNTDHTNIHLPVGISTGPC
ncbi:hypothetical protein VP01_168g1 [Puccinia sorghi]|uniref:Uncharacterized protein n=1 Tax=Puccinia sorghi TaxID=27349 RepID=A0A0L6VGE6_9BASI|nr:hypothetical protein VP01_168g1 [Puccinia sorghi]